MQIEHTIKIIFHKDIPEVEAKRMKHYLVMAKMNLIFCVALWILSGCMLPSPTLVAGGPGPALGGGGPAGATPGGVQDINSARGLIELGRVPDPEAFIVEGMLSEHDFPLDGPVCAKALCLTLGSGIAPDADDLSAAWMQVGLSSNVDMDTYVRPSQALIFTVDVSGSMGYNYGQERPIDIAKSLGLAIAEHLGPDDSAALVTYGSSVTTVFSFTPGNDPRIAQSINALTAGGGTYMEAGLSVAYLLASEYAGTADEVRVLLFTDEQPNIGNTAPGFFRDLVTTGASQGVGISIFGLGLGLNTQVMNAMADLRGGNAFSIMNNIDVSPFMVENWPWLASPIAYDLNISIQSTDLSVTQAYGFPGYTGSETAQLQVSSVFLSKRKGALVLQLNPKVMGPINAGVLANVDMSYSDTAGVLQSEQQTVSYDGTPLDARGVYMPQTSVAKAVALSMLVTGMQRAATAYVPSDPELGVSILDATLTRFDADSVALNDPALNDEAVFWAKLYQLMLAGAPQGDVYGGFLRSLEIQSLER